MQSLDMSEENLIPAIEECKKKALSATQMERMGELKALQKCQSRLGKLKHLLECMTLDEGFDISSYDESLSRMLMDLELISIQDLTRSIEEGRERLKELQQLQSELEAALKTYEKLESLAEAGFQTSVASQDNTIVMDHK